MAIEQLGVAFRHGGRRVEVTCESFELHEGETVVLQAPSGAGKSTFLSLLGGALRPDRAGRFELRLGDGRTLDLARAWREGDERTLAAARREGFGYVLQSGALAGFLTVRENILCPLLFAGRRAGVEIETLAAVLDIGDLLNLRPAQLSTGQRQRVAIARALVGEPQVILADEPTASLDLALAGEVDRLLMAATRGRSTALVLASHNAHAQTWADSPRASFRVHRSDDGMTSVIGREAAA